MISLNLNDKIALAIILFSAAALLLLEVVKRKKPYANLRKVSAYQSIERMIHEAAEKGQRLVLGLGSDLADQNPSVTGVVGLPLLELIGRRSVFNDWPVEALSGDGTLACLSRMVLNGTYQDALASELFDSQNSLLAGVSPFGYLAGLLPEVNHPANAGIILSGNLRPEILLALDLAGRQNIPAIASSGLPTSAAALLISPALIALGEDHFAPGASLESNSAAASSLRVQDLLRIIIAAALVVGALLKLSGLLP